MAEKYKDQLKRMRGQLIRLAHVANLDGELGVAEKAQAAIGVVAMVENEIEGTVFDDVDTDWVPDQGANDV